MIAGECEVLTPEGSMPARLLHRGMAVATLKRRVLHKTVIDGVIQSSTRKLATLYVGDGPRIRKLICTITQRLAVPDHRRRPQACDLSAGDAVYCFDGAVVYATKLLAVSFRQERQDVQTFAPKITAKNARFVANGFVCAGG